MADALPLKRPLRLRTVVAGERSSSFPIVHCPRQAKSIDALACVGCDRMQTLEWNPGVGGEVACAEKESARDQPNDARRADFAEAAARRQLHQVVEPVTVCVPPETSMADVRRLFLERHLRALPVVDDQLRLMGIVSRSDLLAASADALVRDVMPGRVHALPEHAPIGYAIALMAFEKVSEVPVVTDAGELVGLWHALDALRWTAERMGYVMAEATAAPSGSRSGPHFAIGAREC